MKDFIENVKIRKASNGDIDFILEQIIEAERSGTNVSTSCNIFNISEDEFLKTIKRILLDEDFSEHEYCLQGFFVAEYHNEVIGGLGSWIEEMEGYQSGIIKANLFFQYLGKDRMIIPKEKSLLIKKMFIPREKNTLQLEHAYVKENYRRKGVFTKLLKEVIKNNHKRSKNGFEKVQGIIFKDNHISVKAHFKNGYKIVHEVNVNEDDILQIFPYKGKILVELDNNKINKIVNC